MTSLHRGPRQPRLTCWEVPRRDPAEPRPNTPDVQQRT
jgi:hypothetical protein